MIGVEKFGISATVSWRSAPDRHYQLEFPDTLAPTRWANLSPVITATGLTTSEVDNMIGTRNQRYYRVLLLDPP